MPTGVYIRKALSEKHKNNLSIALSGKNHPMFGKKHSDASRKKMSDSHKKQVISKETREKMRQSLIGKIPKNLEMLHKTFQGSTHGNWKGDTAGYNSIHSWIKRWKGIPKKCEHCGASCEEKRLTWANVDHKYRRHVDDFIALCYLCHQRYDKAHNNYPSKNHNQFS